MIKKVSINIRPNDQKSIPVLREVIDYLGNKGIAIQLPDYEFIRKSDLHSYIVKNDVYINSPDLIIVIGGDGTFLRTARLFADRMKPIVGINMGGLGFLIEFTPADIFTHLDDVLKGKFEVIERSMLEAAQFRDGKELVRMDFLNDAVMSKGAFSRLIRIELTINDQYLNSYAGDGLIIATSTGSTAYSLSAGGPIIAPSVDDIYIINPICPHALSARPIVVSNKMILRAKILTSIDNLVLTLDGQVAIQIEGGDEIMVWGSSKKVQMIAHPNRNYYEVLRQKLGWGKN
jgi:NAD+ kinase